MAASDEKSFEVQECTKEERAVLEKHFTHDQGLIHLGPSGYLLNKSYVDEADKIRNMKILPTDVFVDSFARSGTTWTQDMVWLIVNDMDFEKAKSIALTDRYLFLEQFMFFTDINEVFNANNEMNEEKIRLFEKQISRPTEVLAKTPSPRFVKSHLPISLLPKDLGIGKVVYVARDPRDVAVSFYHFTKDNKFIGLTANFKDYYYDLFTKNLVSWSPYFSHVKEAWAMRNHPNFLFLFYEELSKDLRSTAKRVAQFFGKQYTEEQYDQLCSHLDFKNFQKNKAIDLDDLRKLGLIDESCKFIRKGKAGGWREVFDEEMSRHAERWIEDNLKDSDLRFQQ